MEYTLAKVDLHNHLRTSSYITKRDANATIRKAQQALGKNGVLGITTFNPSTTEEDPRWKRFVTCSNELSYESISTGNGLYFPKEELLVVRNQEIPVKEGFHVLLVGLPERVSVTNGTSLEEISRIARGEGALVVMDHPTYKSGFYTEMVKKTNHENGDLSMKGFVGARQNEINKFDLIETHNAEAALDIPGVRDANRKACDLYEAIKKQGLSPKECVSSDGHSIEEIGRAYSIINMPHDYASFENNAKGVTNALRQGYESATSHERGSARIGALNHIADLVTLAIMNRKFGWSDDQTARFFQRFGISI